MALRDEFLARRWAGFAEEERDVRLLLARAVHKDRSQSIAREGARGEDGPIAIVTRYLRRLGIPGEEAFAQ